MTHHPLLSCRQLLAGMAIALGTTTLPAQQSLALDAVIARSLEANLGLRSALLDPVEAEAATAQAEAAFDLQLFSSASLYNDEQDSIGSTSDRRNFSAGARQTVATGANVTAQTSYGRSDGTFFDRDSNQTFGGQLSQSSNVSLSVRQPLLAGRGSKVTQSDLRQAQLGEEAAALEVRETVLDVLVATERAYWNAAAEQQRLSLRASSVEVADQLLRETLERERLGLVTRIDVLQAQAALASRRDDVIVAQQALDAAEDALMQQMGMLLATTPVDQDFALDALPRAGGETPAFAEVWRAALALDPALARQEILVDQREEQRLQARNATRPDLDLTLGTGVTGLDNREAREAYNDAFSGDGHFWQVGLEFSMPWGFKAERARLRSAEARVEQAEIAVISATQALLAEVRGAWRSVRAQQERLVATAASLELQEASFAQERARLDNGLATFRDVLEAQRDLDQARLTDLQARVDLIQARLNLARLDGSLLDRHGLSWDDLALTDTF